VKCYSQVQEAIAGQLKCINRPDEVCRL